MFLNEFPQMMRNTTQYFIFPNYFKKLISLLIFWTFQAIKCYLDFEFP